ncbi:hypothetical protein [Algoriphagus sp. Y33]|uniref:hypothetical protein n=1 Tax=Algoriphagus sp. Y33 TaxID=2772483 RepID=UPI00177EEFC2|nr:hypothetical protein [Algoriphagus sp. Y33]
MSDSFAAVPVTGMAFPLSVILLLETQDLIQTLIPILLDCQKTNLLYPTPGQLDEAFLRQF